MSADVRIGGGLTVAGSCMDKLSAEAVRLGSAKRAVDEYVKGMRQSWACGDWDGLHARLLAAVRARLVADANARVADYGARHRR